MTMQLMTAKEAKNSFGKLMNTMQREPVFITKNNMPVGAFVSLEDLKGTHIVEQFEQPSEEYEEYAKTKVLNALNSFNENGSRGISIEDAKQMIQDRLSSK